MIEKLKIFAIAATGLNTKKYNRCNVVIVINNIEVL